MSEKITVDIPNLAATERVGRLLAETLPDGSVVALIGTLGAGKTHLVKAVAEASGAAPGTVSSPTFVLLHEYEANRPIYHFDAYRLDTAKEFQQLSPDDYFEDNGLTFVEWADKFPVCLPPDHLEIRLEIISDDARQFVFLDRTGRFKETFFRLNKEKHNEFWKS